MIREWAQFLRPRLSLKLAFWGLLIFLPSLLFGGWTFFKIYSSMTTISQNMSNVVTSHIIEMLDRVLFERYGDAVVFSRTPSVRTMDRTNLTAAADLLITSYAPYYCLVTVSDRAGQIVAVNRVAGNALPIQSSKLIGRNEAQEAWFTKTMQADQEVLFEDIQINPFVEEVYQEKKQVLAYHAKIRDSAGRVVGIWTAYINIHPFYEILTNASLAYSQSEPLPLTLVNQRDEEIATVNHQRLNNRASLANAISKGFSHFPGLGWTVYAYEPPNYVSQNKLVIWAAGWFVLVASIGSTGFFWLIHRKILSPVQQLNDLVTKLRMEVDSQDAMARRETGTAVTPSSTTEKIFPKAQAARPADEIENLFEAFRSLSLQVKNHIRCTTGLAEASQAIATTGLSSEAILRTILTTAARLTEARYAALGVFDESGNILSEFYTIGIDETTRCAIGEQPKGHGLLGFMNKEKNPVRLTDLQQHPNSVGFPPHHPPMHSFLGQSLFAKDQLLGRIYLTDKQGAAEFSVEDEHLLVALANLAGVSIANAQLYEKVRDAETRYSQLLESTSEGIFGLDLEGRCTFANQAATEMLGDEEPEMLGQPLHPRVCHNCHHGLPHPVEECTIFKLAQAGQPCHLSKTSLRRKDGTSFIAELSSNPIIMEGNQVTGVVINFTDITQRVQVEESLRRSEERFRQLAETIKQVFWITTPEKNQMLYVSPAYQEIWGRTCESLYASPRDWTEAIHPDDRERIVQAARVKQISDRYHEEYRVVRPDGSVRWILDQAYPLRDTSGTVSRIIGVAEDITERKELEEQLRHSQKMEAIGQLAGGIAHDFNNLLCVINGYSKILLAQIPPDDPLSLKEDLHEIWEAGQRASALTTQLLTLSRKQILQLIVLDINRLIDHVILILGRLLGERIQIRFDPAPGTAWVLADQGYLEQTLMNLALNARDAMPQGGTLTITTNIVHLDQANLPLAPGAYVTISVQDTGTGMSSEVLNRCFEPFFTTKAYGKGTGLGLAMVHGLVTQSKGHITVTSQPGCGTIFTIYLPQVQAMEKEDSEEAGTTPIRTALDPPTRQCANTTVLLVEDEPKVLAVARKILERTGCRVLAARNAGEALVLSAEYPNPIHVLVSDITMPGMTGRELAERLLTARPGIRIVLMSSYTSDVTLQEFLNKTKGCFVPKPLSPDTLMAALADTLAHPAPQEGEG